MMSSTARGRRRTRGWSVFDGVRPPLPSTPEALMSSINAAIAAAEHAHATALLEPLAPHPAAVDENDDSPATAIYDVRRADEAYKAARAALAAGRPDAALRSLRVAIACCPPDRGSAMAKLRALVSIASAQQQQQR